MKTIINVTVLFQILLWTGLFADEVAKYDCNVRKLSKEPQVEEVTSLEGVFGKYKSLVIDIQRDFIVSFWTFDEVNIIDPLSLHDAVLSGNDNISIQIRGLNGFPQVGSSATIRKEMTEFLNNVITLYGLDISPAMVKEYEAMNQDSLSDQARQLSVEIRPLQEEINKLAKEIADLEEKIRLDPKNERVPAWKEEKKEKETEKKRKENGEIKKIAAQLNLVKTIKEIKYIEEEIRENEEKQASPQGIINGTYAENQDIEGRIRQLKERTKRDEWSLAIKESEKKAYEEYKKTVEKEQSELPAIIECYYNSDLKRVDDLLRDIDLEIKRIKDDGVQEEGVNKNIDSKKSISDKKKELNELIKKKTKAKKDLAKLETVKEDLKLNLDRQKIRKCELIAEYNFQRIANQYKNYFFLDRRRMLEFTYRLDSLLAAYASFVKEHNIAAMIKVENDASFTVGLPSVGEALEEYNKLVRATNDSKKQKENWEKAIKHVKDLGSLFNQ